MKPSKLIIAPDSFKGALTAKEAADIIAAEAGARFPGCEVVIMPVADGGEGSAEMIISALGGKMYTANVLSPDDRLIDAVYGVTAKGAAIIEMAQSSGITKQNGLHPMTSSTYGFGQLIDSALRRGAEEFVLCIGGSATTDGGCGMAAALGALFLDENDCSFIPCGETLGKIKRIDTIGVDKRLSERAFTVMCDVDNPLFGRNGAAYIYAPQKGATPEQVAELDSGLRHLGDLLSDHFGRDYASVPGAGAAGGLGAGCMAFLGASVKSGIQAILKLFDFEKQLSGADLIITGEGKLDTQSFSGKVLSGVLSSAGGVPVWSVCGVCDCGEALLRKYGVTVFEASDGISAEESMAAPAKYLGIAAARAMLAIDAADNI